VFFFAIGVLICMATMCSMSSYLHAGSPTVTTLKLNNLKSL
jgi:Na+/proline symporter